MYFMRRCSQTNVFAFEGILMSKIRNQNLMNYIVDTVQFLSNSPVLYGAFNNNANKTLLWHHITPVEEGVRGSVHSCSKKHTWRFFVCTNACWDCFGNFYIILG